MKTLMTCAVSALALSTLPAHADVSGQEAVAQLNEMQLAHLNGEGLAHVETDSLQARDTEALLEPVSAITKDMFLTAETISAEPAARPDKASMDNAESADAGTETKPEPFYEVFEPAKTHPEIYSLMEQESLVMTSSEAQKPDRFEAETGYGGIFYESEEDVARDAILTPEE
ncbi:hypothetical protein [Ponticaulis sp.]|uniref:hypothetical protein n=1 Tax=Ponticaulis sp. TaxID=2020902 RepID=UPI0026305FB7|nr:hypothetical protein [Ponticaulis sp.]MDF1680607.1 hypothetical protein [Ponticaulis sp.]